MTQTEKTGLRVGVWCAVSSKAQATDDKVSLEEQERIGRAFAETIGGEVTAVYRIPGHTRDLIFWTDAEEAMPAYRALREDAEAGRLDVLWNADLDRLGRDPALINQVISLVEKHGAEVYTASTPHPLGQKSAGFRYISAIQAVRAGEEQAIRKARQRTGMKGRVTKRGLFPGLVPMGYRPIHDGASGKVCGYEFDENLGAVELLTEMFLSGKSYEEMAREMNDSPWKPPGRGKRWYGGSIRRMMLNDGYAGYPSWGDYQREERSSAYPALWSRETFEQILRERQRRDVGGYHRRGGGPYSGVAYCKRCGGRMYRGNSNELTSKGPRHYAYMFCGERMRSQGEVLCHRNHIAEHKVTDAVAEFLDWLVTEDNLQAALEQWDEGPGEAVLREDLSRAESAADDLRRQRERLGLAMAAGKMDLDLYRTLDDDLLGKLEAEQAKVSDLRQKIEALPDLDERRATLENLARRFATFVKMAEPEAVATLLQNAGMKVFCEEGEVVEVGLG